MTTPDDLLPCPFCGGEAEFERMGTPRQSCIVVCGNCGARHESGDEGARNGTQWNRRAAAPAAPATPDDLPPTELPDEIRVPLHRIWADIGYLIGRAKKGETDLAVHTVKSLCDELERAIRAALAAAPAAPAPDLEQLRRDLCVIGVVGSIDSHDVIRRNSMLDIVDRARHADR